MRDILKESYDIIVADEEVQQYVGNNIFFDVYPEVGSYKKPYIVMSDLDDPLPREYADNDNLALSYLINVDLFIPVSSQYNGHVVCKELAYHIGRLLKDNLGLTNTSNSKPEYDKEYKIYRRSRNYEGVFYRQNKLME